MHPNYRLFQGLILLIAVSLLIVSTPLTGAEETATAATANAPAAKLKVGVLVSRFTAEGPHWTGKPYGWRHANIARRLKDDFIELCPIVDPDTVADEGVLKAIAENFPAGAEHRVIDGADADRLSRLDVIVAQRVWNLDERAVEPLLKAVSAGVSLVNIGSTGVVTPGFSLVVNPLNAMDDDATYAWHPREQPVEFVDGSKLGLEAKPKAGEPEAEVLAAEALKLKPNGAMGSLKPGTAPLMKLAPGAANVGFPQHPAPVGAVFYPLLFGELEKGRILVCNMADVSPSRRRELHPQGSTCHGEGGARSVSNRRSWT